MDDEELKNRTRKFATAIFKLIDKLPNTKSAHIIANQVGRCGSAVAANYRSSCRSRSHAEFIARIGVVEEESDESKFWLEMLRDTNKSHAIEIDSLIKEADELTAIFTASGKTAKGNRDNKK
jgi:four helix bundle protein